MTSNQTRGRLTLLAIATIFALPIAVAMYLYFSDDGWRPGEHTQHGDLISPPRQLPDTPLLPDDDTKRFRQVWSLVVLSDAQCDEVCADALVKIRQVRLWLGPKIDRMQTVALPAKSGAITPEVRARHPMLIVADPALSQATRGEIGGYNNGQIFLVDPLGNLMMSYQPGTDMGDIRKDVGHLLRISNIG